MGFSLHIRLFGPLELTFEDAPSQPGWTRDRCLTEEEAAPSAPSSPTARSLLAYLILHRDRRIPRDRLVGIFWPERPDSRARRALSNALWQIRQALGPAADRLVTEGDTVAFGMEAGDWLDVEALEEKVHKYIGRQVDEALPPHLLVSLSTCLLELSEAVALYRGDFLEGIYDDWALVERERLRELYLRALERLIALHKRRSDYKRALAYAQRLTTADPLREAAHRELMRLYHLLGRPRSALEQFEALRDLLAEELGGEPSAATVALYREIVAALEEAASPHLPLPPPPPPLLRDLAHLPFVGRMGERAKLIGALQAALQGRGEVALVEGDAGVGKTRLVEEAIAGARWRGFQVGLGKADSLAASSPYQLLREALTPLLTPLRVAQLAELMEPLWLSAVAPLFPLLARQLPDLPPLPSLDPQEERRRLWEGLSRCLVGLASIAPLLLVLEDLHWADEATLAALSHLAPRFPANRALLVLTYRPAEAHQRAVVWETLGALDRALPLLRIRLSSFERSEAVALVRRALGVGETDAAATAFARRLEREIGTNALFLVETLKSLLERGDLAPASGPSSGGWRFPAEDLPLSTPTSLQELVGERVTRLSAELRDVLERVAVLGECADFPILARVSDTETTALLSALEELARRGFLLETAQRYCFEHDTIQGVVYQAIAPERQRKLHRQVGMALETVHPEQIKTLAHHYERGQAWRKAMHYRRQAGEEAAALQAYPMAMHHYDRAIALSDKAHLSPDQRFDLLAAREAALDVLGRREEQTASLEMMTQLAQNDLRRMAQVCQRRAWLLLRISQYPEAEAAARRALALAHQLESAIHQAKALTILGTILHQRGDMREAIPILEAAIDLYQGLEDLPGEAKAQRALAAAFHGTGAYAAAREAVTTALARYETLRDRAGQAEALGQSGALHMEQGELDEAVACYRQALRICRAIGYRYEEAKSLTNLGNVCYFQGQISEALDCYDAAIAIFTSVGDRRGEAFVRANAATVRHMTLGDDEVAARDAEAALAFYAQVGDRAGEGQCLDILGGISLRRGELAEAWEQWEGALTAMQAAGDQWGEVSVHRSLIDLALEEGRVQLAQEHLETAAALCEALDLPDRAVALQADLGNVLLALGQPEAALAATTQAMTELNPGVEQGYLIPFIHHRVLVALGRAKEARAAIEQAYQMLFEALKGLSPEQQAMSLKQVPEHRAIVAAQDAICPRRESVRLPAVDAPTGRPLREDEVVEVIWTVAAPEDDEVPGRVARRRHRILRLLREAAEQSAAPTLNDLAEALDVSVSTIKRDLAALRKAGHDVRTRGSRNR